MRVLYDITVLGAAHRDNGMRTGIFRVADRIARRLVRSKRCEVVLCGPSDIEGINACESYLRGDKELAGARIADPGWRRWVRAWHPRLIRRLRRLGSMEIPPLRKRSPVHGQIGLRDFIRDLHLMARLEMKWGGRVEQAIVNMRPLSSGEVERADIYHSPHLAIPAYVRRKRGPACFLTVCDLIPVVHPEYFCGNSEVARGSFTSILKSLRPGDWVHCISEATRDDVCKLMPWLDESRVFVAHLAASPEMFCPCTSNDEIERVRRKYGISDGGYLLSVCTFEPRKNIDRVIRCFGRLLAARELKDVSLVLVGAKGWNTGRIEKALADHAWIKERVVVTGYVPDEDLSPLYSGGRAFVYPSFYEGFGLPPLEAMQCGVPVITSNTSSLPEVVADAGIMVSPTDEDAICQSMLRLCRDDRLRGELSTRALERCRLFSWERCVDRILAAYEQAAVT
jgi:glycosyltransferase involved in cell wall biosynthesis